MKKKLQPPLRAVGSVAHVDHEGLSEVRAPASGQDPLPQEGAPSVLTGTGEEGGEEGRKVLGVVCVYRGWMNEDRGL